MTSGRAGFTLIELLAALAILAMALAVTFRILSGGLASADAAKSYGRAVAVAESRMAALMAAERLAPGEWSGRSMDLAWIDRVGTADEPAFAVAGAEGFAALTVRVRVTARDGRAVELRSVKLVRQ